MSKNTGGPAFPSHGSMGEVVQEGMTLRDYFAVKAMKAYICNNHLHERAIDIANHEDDFGGDEALCLSEQAYRMADAMIDERAK